MHDPNPNTVISFALSEEAGGLLDQLQGVRQVRSAGLMEYRGTYRLTSRSAAVPAVVCPVVVCPVVVCLTGVGIDSARQAVHGFLAHYRPTWWIAAGFAGGLSADLQPCELVMAQCVVDSESGQRLDTGVRPASVSQSYGQGSRQGSEPRIGDFVTVPQILRTSLEKRAMAERTGAIACDMESFALADACRQHGVRFLGVRVISDTIDETLPPEIASIAAQPTWGKRFSAAASAVWSRPSAAKDLWNLQQRVWEGSHQLGTHLLQSVLPALSRHSPSTPQGTETVPPPQGTEHE